MGSSQPASSLHNINLRWRNEYEESRKTMKRFWPLYLMFMPGVIYLFINCYIPMFGIQIAFRQYNARDGIYGSPWCGFKNFEFLFRTNDASS